MQVNLKLHGILRDYLPRQAKGQTTLHLPDDASIEDVISQLEIKQTVSAVVNGTEVENDYNLQDGDDLQMFRLIAGG